MVPYKGSLEDTLSKCKQDLQSSISYAGGKDIEAIRKVDYVIVKTQFLTEIQFRIIIEQKEKSFCFLVFLYLFFGICLIYYGKELSQSGGTTYVVI